MKNNNTYIFNKNFTEDLGGPAVIENYAYEPRENDEFSFFDTCEDAFNRFSNETWKRDDVSVLYSGMLSESALSRSVKNERMCSFFGFESGSERKFFVFPKTN